MNALSIFLAASTLEEATFEFIFTKVIPEVKQEKLEKSKVLNQEIAKEMHTLKLMIDKKRKKL